MTFFGIRTAKPVAYIERHFLGLKGKSYFVMEYIDGQHAGEYLLHDQQSEAKLDKMIARITQLLKNLARLELTHGDLKITNILIDQDEQPLLIDLDGAAEHRSVDSLRKAWQKEIKRFLRNFDSDSALSKKFKAMLGSVDN